MEQREQAPPEKTKWTAWKDSAIGCGWLLLVAASFLVPVALLWGAAESASAFSWRQFAAVAALVYGGHLAFSYAQARFSRLTSAVDRLHEEIRDVRRLLVEMDERVRRLPKQTSRKVYEDLSEDVAFIQHNVTSLVKQAGGAERRIPSEIGSTDEDA